MNGGIVPPSEIIYIIGCHLIESLFFEGKMSMRCQIVPVETVPADTMKKPSATTPVFLSATPV
jgi:hypothetical protein